MFSVQTTVRNLGRMALNLIVPAQCPVCLDDLALNSTPNICSKCWPDLPRWDQTTPPPPGLPPKVDFFTAPFLYEEPISELIQKLKYADEPRLAEVLSKFFIPLIPADADVLIPVPLFPKRFRQRAYNQAGELLKFLIKNSEYSADFYELNRIKWAQSQVGQNAATRRRQMSGAFAAKGKYAGKHVVLIDDVWTTGATTNACAMALKKTGVKKVSVVTLAYVAPHK
jgi:ComF family protein